MADQKGLATESTPVEEQRRVAMMGAHPDREKMKAYYRGMHPAHQRSLKHCASIVITKEHEMEIRRWLGNYSANTLARAIILAVDDRWQLGELLETKGCLAGMHCYNEESSFIPSEVLVNGKNVIVMAGQLADGREVAVKWSRNRKVADEIDIYRKLHDMGCPTPWFADNFYMMGEPVLVMERLQKINSKDDPYAVGVAVLNQLAYLHKIGVHNDLKPGNIMKRLNDSKQPEYFMIDHGGVTTQRMGDGYRRHIWTDKYAAQPAHVKGQETSAKYDFIELGRTIAAIKTLEDETDTQSIRVNPQQVRDIFRGRHDRYMKLADSLPERHTEAAARWTELRDILLDKL